MHKQIVEVVKKKTKQAKMILKKKKNGWTKEIDKFNYAPSMILPFLSL